MSATASVTSGTLCNSLLSGGDFTGIFKPADIKNHRQLVIKHTGPTGCGEFDNEPGCV